MQRIDIINVFLHGQQLDKNIVMRQPASFLDEFKPRHVCLLKKALYGLKQASRMWFKHLKQSLLSMRFKACQSDNSLFVRVKVPRTCAKARYARALIVGL